MPLTPITPGTGTVTAIAPDVVAAGLTPSPTLHPSPSLHPAGSRTGMQPIIPRSGGVLTPISPS